VGLAGTEKKTRKKMGDVVEGKGRGPGRGARFPMTRKGGLAVGKRVTNAGRGYKGGGDNNFYISQEKLRAAERRTLGEFASRQSWSGEARPWGLLRLDSKRPWDGKFHKKEEKFCRGWPRSLADR